MMLKAVRVAQIRFDQPSRLASFTRVFFCCVYCILLLGYLDVQHKQEHSGRELPH